MKLWQLAIVGYGAYMLTKAGRDKSSAATNVTYRLKDGTVVGSTPTGQDYDRMTAELKRLVSEVQSKGVGKVNIANVEATRYVGDTNTGVKEWVGYTATYKVDGRVYRHTILKNSKTVREIT